MSFQLSIQITLLFLETFPYSLSTHEMELIQWRVYVCATPEVNKKSGVNLAVIVNWHGDYEEKKL